MTTFSELLARSRSSSSRGILWTPSETEAGGLLVIHDKRDQVTYLVAEFATDATGRTNCLALADWRGRAFRLVKATEGTDPESESEDVLIHEDGRSHRCTCRGFVRWEHCKHLDALLAILGNGWFPDRPVKCR